MPFMHQSNQLFLLNFGISVMLPDIVISIDLELRVTIFEFYCKFIDNFSDQINISCIYEVIDSFALFCSAVKIQVDQVSKLNEYENGLFKLTFQGQLNRQPLVNWLPIQIYQCRIVFEKKFEYLLFTPDDSKMNNSVASIFMVQIKHCS